MCSWKSASNVFAILKIREELLMSEIRWAPLRASDVLFLSLVGTLKELTWSSSWACPSVNGLHVAGKIVYLVQKCYVSQRFCRQKNPMSCNVCGNISSFRNVNARF